MRVSVLLLAFGCAATPAPAPRRAAPAPLGPPAAEDPRPPTATSGTLDDIVRRDLARDHALPWGATRTLSWQDFQGQPPSAGPEGAKISYILYSVWRCRGQAFEYRVVVGMRPGQSWVKTAVLQDSVQRWTLLGHEQTHFDLGEVYARRMRQAFRDLAGPCRKTDAELGALADRLGQEEQAEQRRYDAETNHGLRDAQQAAWSLQTARRLSAARY